MSGTILVGYDGTEGADAALDEALRLAGEVGGPVVAVFAYKKVTVGGESHDLDREVAERAEAMLARARERAERAGTTLETAFVEGPPADVLVQEAEARDARCVVIGSYGERPLRGVLVGATPFKLIHLCERPVLIVRAPDA
jgi:nucleotide-binding universal stress UspA family protein